MILQSSQEQAVVGDQVDRDCDGSEICYVSDDDDHRTTDTLRRFKH